MAQYIVKRLLLLFPTLFVIAVVSFGIIHLPPGNYLDTYIANLAATGETATEDEIAALEARYGLNKPLPAQFLRWLWGFVRGDFGQSFQHEKPVRTLIGERLLFTVVISLLSIVFTYVMSIPIGIYSAVRQYSPADHLFTGVGFLGLSIPNFMLALVLLFVLYRNFDIVGIGLFSDAYIEAPWSLAKGFDLLKHLIIPVIVIGTAGTAGLIRVMRGNLLDEISRQYVITARAKGLGERRLLFKYPVRLAVNPLVSSVAWLLPEIISGETITAVVLSLATVGPLLLSSLLAQDMFLAGTIVMFMAFLTVIGTLVSDLLLAAIDPRIRFEARGA